MQHPEKKAVVSGKRKPIVWIAALLFLLAAIGTVFLLPKVLKQTSKQNTVSSSTESTQRTFDAPSQASIESITVRPAEDAEAYTLLYADETLMLETSDGPIDISKTLASDFLEVVTELTVQDTISETEEEYSPHLEEMGLQPAAARADIQYTDGTTAWIEVGIQVPNTNGYYARYSVQKGVYVCDSGVYETLRTEKKRLLAIEQPAIEAIRIDRAEVILPAEQMVLSFTSDSLGTRYGTLMSPYEYPLSQDAVTTLLTAFQNIRLGTRESISLSEAYHSYGFDSPICVLRVHLNSGRVSEINDEGELVTVERAEQNLEFIIGREEGDYFYTCAYDGTVYLVSRFLFQTLVNLSSSDIVSYTPANLGGDIFLSSIEIVASQGSLSVEATRTERVLENNEIETDEDGNVVYDLSVTENGTEISEDRYNELCERLNELTTSGTITEDWTPSENQAPRWKITITTEGGVSRRIEAYKMDAFSDALSVDGTVKQYISEEAIDGIISDFIQ